MLCSLAQQVTTSFIAATSPKCNGLANFSQTRVQDGIHALCVLTPSLLPRGEDFLLFFVAPRRVDEDSILGVYAVAKKVR